ncbi:hypothetical protein SEA_BUTTON_38 [Gordonia phage Button]|nr:hypothetical protein SEA_BUTTON_38 [Gordonia phage Button]WKW84831.1 helix-turn-helix DNA binding domain protein [Gordonia phage Jamzy]
MSAEQDRRSVLELIDGLDEPVSITQIASTLDMTPLQVRGHLRALMTVGMVGPSGSRPTVWSAL